MRHRYRFLVPLAIFVVALALRLYAIDLQSMWADEGGSLALAGREPLVILRDTLQDVHPPLYYWLLHAWMALWGATPAAARMLSALCGALAAAATAAVGRRWFGSVAGVLAGLAAACSPFAIHYSQEARMYALAMLLAILAWWAADRWLQRPTPAALIVYTLCAALLLATHYFTVAIVVAVNIFVLLSLARTRRSQPGVLRHAGWWLGIHAVLAAGYLAAVWTSQTRLEGWTATKAELPPLVILADVARVWSVGPSTPPQIGAWSIVLCVLACAGVAYAGVGERAGRRLATGLWLVVPVVLIVALSLRQPYYKARFLLPALPAFHLLLGNGAAGLVQFVNSRFRRNAWPGALATLAIVAGLAAAAWQPLRNEWFDPTYWRDDYRGAAQAIDATMAPGDAVIYNGQSQVETLDLYLRGGPDSFLTPPFRPLDVAATTTELAGIAAQHRRVYGLFYVLEESDPQGVIAGWLDEHAFRASSRWYGGLQLVIWETQPVDAQPREIGARFANRALLASAAVEPEEARPTDGIRVQLDWRDIPGERPLNVFAHLLDANGAVVAQYDGPLQPAGTVRLAVVVPPKAPAGAYRLIAGVYDPQTGARVLTETGADHVDLAAIRVQ